MKKLLATLMLLSVLVQTSYARDAAGGFFIPGTGSCGEIINDSLSENNAAVDKMYLQGVAAGINSAILGRQDYFAGTDMESRYQFVLKYCKDNPLENMWNGIVEMVKKLNNGKNIEELSNSRKK